MKETTQAVMKALEEYKSERLNEIFSFVADVILNNKDFAISIKGEQYKMLPVIKTMTGRELQLDILTDEDRDIFGKLIDAVYNEKLSDEKLKELLAEIIESPALFEGFCLNFYGEDDELEEICEMLGCRSLYEALSEDACFNQRRKYALKMADYATAAAGYYGALHFNDLIEIIDKYEDLEAAYETYQRTEGGYKNTIFFTPEYFFLYTFKELVSGISRDVLCTVDGLLLNSFYEDQYLDEMQQYMEFVSKVPALNQDNLSLFFNVTSNAGYRVLMRSSSSYELYIPPKKKLFKYLDDEYVEETKSETRFRKYMKDKYSDRLEARADEYDCTLDDCLDDFVAEFRIQETDEPDSIYTSEGILEYALAIMEGFGITVEDGEDKAELADFAGRMVGDMHKWIYHGWTANEAEDHRVKKGTE